MKEINITELKQIELGILREVHQFCVRHGIRYFLCGGTLLGAVRHGGFIPWDDDIDLYMPRPDYERFLEIFTNQHHLKVLSFPNTCGYYLPFAKVCDTRTYVKETLVKSIPGCGVYIDIFPLDGLSCNRKTARAIINRNRKYMLLNNLAGCNPYKIDGVRSLVKRGIQIALSRAVLVRRINTNSKQYSYTDSDYVGVAFGFYGEREIHSRSVFASQTEIKFENELFYGPFDADAYLSALYGDYMKLPPMEKRVTHHSFWAFWKD